MDNVTTQVSLDLTTTAEALDMARGARRSVAAVSYTHLTLPTTSP